MLTLFLLKSNNVERMFFAPTIYVGGGTKKMQTKCIFAVSITKLGCCHVLVKGLAAGRQSGGGTRDNRSICICNV